MSSFTSLDIVEAAGAIDRFLAGMSEDEWIDDEVRQSAVMHQLIIIGEAALTRPRGSASTNTPGSAGAARTGTPNCLPALKGQGRAHRGRRPAGTAKQQESIMSALTPILPRPSLQLVSLLLVSILTHSACAPLPGRAVGLTPNPQPAAATAASAQPIGDLLPPANGLAHTWRDYETALVRAILPPTLANGVCDWQVLGHTGLEVYVWAFCAVHQPAADITAASVPVVLALADDGHTVTARIPRDGSYYPEDVRALFPADVQQLVFDLPSTETLTRLEQHARRRLILSILPPLGAAETVKPRPDIAAASAQIALYSGRDDPQWDLSELDLAQLDALLEGLPRVDCPSLPDQLGYRGVVVSLGYADESRMNAFNGTLWFGYAGASPQATCLADSDREVERFLLGSAQPYLDPQVFNAVSAALPLPVPPPLATPSPMPTLAPGFVRDADAVFGVQFARPRDWEQCQVTGLSRLYCVAGPPTENPVAPPAFYFTLLPPGFMNEDASAYNWWSPDELAAAFAAGIGEQFTSPRVPAGYEKYHTYTRLADLTVDGSSAIVVENERPWAIAVGTRDRRVLIRLGDAVLVVGAYYMTEEELRDFEEVVTSFRIGAP